MTEPTLRAGLLLGGHFEMLERLGCGSFGEVWKARYERLDRIVAVKVMRSELSRDVSLTTRFETEARALAKINHENVVKVWEQGEWEGRPFVVVEYVEGPTLRGWLEGHRCMRQSTSLEEVRALFGQVCDGVEAAHRKGIVHRDLKPENVLIGTDEQGKPAAKVLDFGLAGGSTLQAAAGPQGGTPQYMSPEQGAGGGDVVGLASDVFALAVMLVEMLTGRLLPEPPEETTWWKAAQLRRVPAALVKVALVRGEVPSGVWSIVERALALDPGERPGSAGPLRLLIEAAWERPATIPSVINLRSIVGPTAIAALSTVPAPEPATSAAPVTALAERRATDQSGMRPRTVAILAVGAFVAMVLGAELALTLTSPTTGRLGNDSDQDASVMAPATHAIHAATSGPVRRLASPSGSISAAAPAPRSGSAVETPTTRNDSAVMPVTTASEVDGYARGPRRHEDYCRRHPGQLHPRTGTICPSVLGSHNLQR